MEEFIKHLQAEDKSESTVAHYRASLNRFTKWFESQNPHTPPDGVSGFAGLATQADISNFKRFAVKNYKPGTVRQTLTHLQVYFSFLERKGLVPDNPVEHVKSVQAPASTPKWLTKNEQNALIRLIRKHGNLRELTIFTFLLHTGLRVQELCDVRMNDIEISERKGKVIVRSGKHGKYREVPLNVDVRTLLTKYIEQYKPSEYLITTERSAQATTRAVQFIVEKYRKLAGIRHLTAHSLRHSFCHELVSRKIPLDVVARLAGHMKSDGSPNITQTLVYTLPDENDLANAVEELSWI